MLETVIIKWQEKVDILSKEDFRKYDLWVHSVELVFTMNEPNLKDVYNLLCKN